MKIGIDISQIVYTGTGIARYTKNLVASLSDLGVDLHLFGAAFNRLTQLNQLYDASIKNSRTTKYFYPIPPKLLHILWNRWHTFSVDHLIKPVDIFHTSDWTEPPTRFPKLTTIHDLVVYKYPHYLPQQIIETQKSKLAWVKRECATVIADSMSTKADIVAILGIPDSKIHVVPLGIDSSFSPPTKEERLRVQEKYALRKEYFLCVGTREPRKNLQMVIDAFSQIKNKNMELVIVGNFGWGTDTQVTNDVRVLGYVPDTDLPALYAQSIAFVYPSLYEGFGLPVLEALACGALVITSNTGSLKEIGEKIVIRVDPQNSGDIAEKMKYANSLNFRKRDALLLLSQKYTKGFTWKKTAEKTIEVYKNIITDTSL